MPDTPPSPDQAPLPRLFWEDFPVGHVFEVGSHCFTAEEIIGFARQYDPQAFHIDPVAAASSAFGGLVASGWHVVLVAMRLSCDAYLLRSAGMGSPGVDDLRWLKPVRAGDTITYRRTVREARPSNSKPGMGLINMVGDGTNQHGETVMTMSAWTMMGRRPAS